MKDKAITLSLFNLDSLEANNGLPQYKQLIDKFVTYIKTGLLVPGQMLPSTRDLAAHLRISRKTVLRAYEELLTLGVLDTARGVGTFISERNEIAADTKYSASRGLLIPPFSSYARHLLSKRNSLEALETALNFCAVPPEFLPAKDWTRCKLEILRYLNMAWQDCPPGTPRASSMQLRKALVDYLARRKNIVCTAAQIRVFMSTKAPLWVLSSLFLDEGDSVVVENPGYPHARAIFSAHGCKVVPISVDREGIMVDEIEKLLPCPKLIYVTPFHDPLGLDLSMARREALLVLCQRRGILLIEDDYGSELRSNELMLPSLYSLDQAKQVVYLSSFWSSLYPLTTAGFVVLPAHLEEAFERAVSLSGNLFSPELPCLEELTLNRFITKGLFDQHLDRLKAVLQARSEALQLAIAEHLPGLVGCDACRGGMHLPVRFPPNIDFFTIESCAREARLGLVSSSAYYVAEAPANEYLLPFVLWESKEMAVKIENFARRLVDCTGFC